MDDTKRNEKETAIWLSGEPKNLLFERCAVLSIRGSVTGVNNVPCWYSYYGICEKQEA